MGNSMVKVIFSVLVCAVLAVASSVTIAEAASQAPKAEQKAVLPVEHSVYMDAKGNRIDVVTFENGTFSVFMNKEELGAGSSLAEVLANHGVTLSVDSQGKITAEKILEGGRIVEAHHAVTSDGLQETGLFFGLRTAALPAGLAVQAREVTDWASTALTFRPSVENNLNEKPISK